jgi:L-asparaginase / beta-aspartyl-peptidase
LPQTFLKWGTKVKTSKIASVAVALCIGILGFSNASPGQPDDQAAIRGTLAAQQGAWNEGNVEAFLQGYWRSDELTFSGSSGVARGFDAVRQRYLKSYPDRQAMGKLDFSGLEIRMLGPEAALVLGKWHLTREKDVGGVFSVVFQRFPDGWRIIHDHTSVVAQQTPN